MKNTNKTQAKKYFFGFIQLIFAFVILTSAAKAATYVVSNTNNSGLGSLRQAILNANANPGDDFITFGIPGGGVHEIKVGLPELVITDTVNINGASEPGYTNHPLIVIRPTGGQGGWGFKITNGTATVRALNFYGYINAIIVDCEITSTTCEGDRPGLILRGSRIGTNNDGSSFADLHNSTGIFINGANAGSTQIGGTGANDANVISHNGTGIKYLNTPCNNCTPNNDPGRSHLVIGNKIGTNFAGTAAINNSKYGIEVGTEKVRIGGDTAAERNVISGNKEHGIISFADKTIIEGNYIGTNAAGTAAIPNLLNGVVVSGASNNRIGGAAAGTGNVISGNGESGLAILPKVISCGVCNDQIELATNNLIYGNLIGTNAAGTAKLPNGENGVVINAEGTVVGETETGGATNTISGNTQNGVFIFESEHHTNFNDPNFALFISSKNNRIQRNYIGTNAAGANLGNTKNGVLIDGDVSNTFIGGNDAARKNLISFNGANGISLINTADSGANLPPVNNQITYNDISANNIKGIALYANDSQGGDALDADEGANNLQNHPTLEAAFPSSIVGKFHGAPNKSVAVHLYSVQFCDQSGRGEGKTFIGETSVLTDAAGNGNFTTNFGVPAGSIITATATELKRVNDEDLASTSEFSNCVVVQNADPGGFSLDSAAYSTTENGNSVTVTVNRTGGTLGGVTVNYSITNGTATAGKDFVAHSSTLTFAAGQTTKIFAVPILEDSIDEAAETVNISLSNPSVGAILNTPNAATLTINDNDQPPTLSIADVTMAEGNQNLTNFIFTVTKTGATEQNVTVNYQTVGVTATGGVDYTNTSGTLTIAANETVKQITVPVIGELTIETDEAFKLVLSAPVNAALGNTEATGTIVDDDNPGKLQFSQASYDAAENAGAAIVQISRTGGKVGTVTVDYATTVNGTATANADFTSASGTVTFLDGELTKTVQIFVNDDQSPEPTETINLVLSSPTGGATLGSPSNASINIIDNDAPPPTASIAGKVFYAISLANQQQKIVPGVAFNATGTSSATDTTDLLGVYQLENLTAGGQYDVSAVKTGDANGISALDATLILRHVAANGQGVNALSPIQQTAADVSNGGGVSALDATMVLRYVATGGQQTVLTGQTGNWKLLPSMRSYQSVGAPITGENYEAVLLGEVNDSWQPPQPQPTASEFATQNEDANPDAEISLPLDQVTEADENGIVVVPVRLTNYAGGKIAAYYFDLRFNPNVLQPDETAAVEATETLSERMTLVYDAAKPGRIGIAVADNRSDTDAAQTASGVLLKLRFKVIAAQSAKNGGLTVLKFGKSMTFETGEGLKLNVKRTNGALRIVSVENLDKTAVQ